MMKGAPPPLTTEDAEESYEVEGGYPEHHPDASKITLSGDSKEVEYARVIKSLTSFFAYNDVDTVGRMATIKCVPQSGADVFGRQRRRAPRARRGKPSGAAVLLLWPCACAA